MNGVMNHLAALSDDRNASRERSEHEGREKNSFALENVKKGKELQYKIRVFIYDLRHFRSNAASKERLESITSYDYLSPPHFTDEEAILLRNITVIKDNGRALSDELDAFFTSKMEERLEKVRKESDWRLCVAHDLASIFERVFEIRGEELGKDKRFLRSGEG